MDEVQEFMDKANYKLKSSQILYDSGQYIDSVSASYYVMLLVAKALLINKGIRPKTHKGIMHLFSKEFIKGGDFDPILGRKFLRTQTLRENADYEIRVNIDKRIAKEKLDQCKLFIKEADKFL